MSDDRRQRAERPAGPWPARLWVAGAAAALAALAGALAGATPTAGRIALAVVLAALVGVAGAALWRTRLALLASRRALDSRRAELATLHAIGRELLAAVEPQRVAAVVDRECRKILDADDVRLVAVEPDGGIASLHPPGAPLDRVIGLVEWVARERQSLRLDDAADLPPGSPLAGDGWREMRAAIAVPLIVEERVVGVLCVRSRRPRAFDAAAVELTATVGQQAAAAIESARHYRMATVDSLTGCFQRGYLFRRLDEEYERVVRYRGSFAVLMLDLDGFKAINDTVGHLAGDRYLRAVAAAVRGELRSADLAGRFGGDEFCLLLPETDLDGARAIAERIRRAVASASIVTGEHRRVQTTVSIGVAAFPQHEADSARAVLSNADQALYRAKREGRDRVVPFAA